MPHLSHLTGSHQEMLELGPGQMSADTGFGSNHKEENTMKR